MPSRPELLAAIPLFSTMDQYERAGVAELMRETTFGQGDLLYAARQRGDSCYIITAGRVELSLVDGDGAPVVIDVAEPGDICGELSLLDGGERSMQARALEPTSALMLERDAFISLLRAQPDAALDVMQVLVQRIRHVDKLLGQRVSRNANEAVDQGATLGERVADGVARFGGSWTFICSFGAFLLVWVSINTWLIFYDRSGQPFDPYPFILLNLLLSMLAALQAPVIMMSQNRQDAKDRIRSELDYQVNLKAELEVAELHRKIDALHDALLPADAPAERSQPPSETVRPPAAS